MPDDITGTVGAYDRDFQPVAPCPDCEDGYRYNSPLASRPGPCHTCGGEGWVGVEQDCADWDGGWI